MIRRFLFAAVLVAPLSAFASDQEMTFDEALEGLKEFGIVTQEATQEAWENAPERLNATIEQMEADIEEAGDSASEASKAALEKLKEIKETLAEGAEDAVDGADEATSGLRAGFRDFFMNMEGAWKDFWE
ncbi:MAG: hypothetical protein NXI16_05780 [Alphaproteobacteria bacterium]|nr:hypothetical protein [Alphaproteobacteria bacterium]